MIKDVSNAKALVDLLFEASGILEESVASARETCPEAEFNEYRTAIADVLGEVWNSILQPILTLHPELSPDGLDLLQ
jgi:hypothetical protein